MLNHRPGKEVNNCLIKARKLPAQIFIISVLTIMLSLLFCCFVCLFLFKLGRNNTDNVDGIVSNSVGVLFKTF